MPSTLFVTKHQKRMLSLPIPKIKKVKRDVTEFGKGWRRAVALRERGIVLWTIRHSNRSIEQFVALLKAHKIEALVDIRGFPTSKIEHFRREEMKRWLPENGIEYVWFGKELGGYR